MRELDIPEPGRALFFETDQQPHSTTQVYIESYQFEDIVAPGNHGHVPRSGVDLEAQAAYEITQEQLAFIGLPAGLAGSLDIRNPATAQFLIDEMAHTEGATNSSSLSDAQSMNERWQRLFEHLDTIDAPEPDVADTADMYQAYCQAYPEINPISTNNSQLHPRQLGHYALTG